MSLPWQLRAATATPVSQRADAAAEIHPVVPEVRPSTYFRWQPIWAWLATLLLTPIFVPVIAVLVLLVRLTSRGPGLYRQLRVGKNGKTFRIYKIRTMRCDAEAETGPVWTDENDPRITPLGRWLRRLHLDELPQLFNVLLGQMTLIGPRPERPEFTQYLARAIPGYLQRNKVLPGITGLAQINLPPDSDLDSVRRKLVLDLEYVQKANFWLDFRIGLCTGLKMLGLPGLVIARWLGLLRSVRIPVWMCNGKHESHLGPATYGRAIQHVTLQSNPQDAGELPALYRRIVHKPR